MDELKINLLEDSEGIAMVSGYMIGINILALPNTVAGCAKQDGWVSIIVGSLYPIFLVLLSIFYVKKHPNEDILALSKKYLGKVLGSICNILFAVQFSLYFVFILAGVSNVYRVYATPFLSPIKIFIPALFLSGYLSSRGLKVLGRVNKIALYATILLTVILLTVLQRGNYLNLLPIIGVSYKNVLNGSIKSLFAYGGIEGIFLIYPFLKNKNKIAAIAFKGTFTTIGIYIWVIMASIYYLGYRVTVKSLWPVLLMTEAVNIPMLNSFRLIFLLLWSIVIFKILGNEQYAITHIISDTIKVKNKNNIYWATFPIAIYSCLKLGNEVQRRAFINYIIPIVTTFNIFYITLIALLMFIKDKWGKVQT